MLVAGRCAVSQRMACSLRFAASERQSPSLDMTQQKSSTRELEGGNIPFTERLKDALDTARSQREDRRAARDPSRPLARYRKILSTAQQIASVNPRGLPELVRAVLRPMQSEHLLGVAELGRDAYPQIEAGKFFTAATSRLMFTPDGMRYRGKPIETTAIRLRLARDVVLPCAWNEQRYVGALACIGGNKLDDRSTAWRQDFNHQVMLWLPWGIGFVTGGNHSITAGILAGEGVIQPGEAYDMSYLLDELSCDGLHFWCTRTGEKVAPVTDPRVAAVFEIGRIMRDLGVTPDFGGGEGRQPSVRVEGHGPI